LVEEPVSELEDADTTLEPGANIALQVPKLLKPDRVLVEVDEPTPMADAMKLYDLRQESLPLLPALTTTVTPESTTASTATRDESGVVYDPKLMVITAGF